LIFLLGKRLLRRFFLSILLVEIEFGEETPEGLTLKEKG
jgi:hypothetical protein